MRKKILCAIMSAVMAVGMMTGCGSKETTSNKTVENVSDKSDKTEEKYAERMEAYLDYFQSEEKEYDGVVAAAITLDSDSLPLLWLAYADSKDRGSDMRFQLCVYENDKVDVMAEKRIEDVYAVGAYLNDGISALYLGFDNGDGDDPAALIYDSEEQDFRFYDENNFKYEGYNNADEYCEKMQSQDIMDAYRIMYRQCQFLTLNYGDETAYFGMMDKNDFYYDLLNSIGALDASVLTHEGDNMCGRILKNEFKDDKIVSKIFDEHFKKKEGKDYYLTYSDSYLPDGTLATDDEEAMCKYFDITKEDFTNSGLALRQTDCSVEFLSNMDAKALMRNLIKHPAYTSFDILLANAKLYEDSNAAANWKFGDIVEVKELLKDAADNKDNSVDSTESTESIKREDSTEISKETNNNMPAWKQAYIDYINGLDEQIDAYRLVDINSDNIPEIYYQYNTKTSAKLMYLNHADEVKTLDAIHASSNFGYNSRGIVDGFTRTGVTTELMYKYDSSKDEYIQIFHGSYTDGIGNNGVKQYKINGVEVPIDEYITAFNQADLNSEFNNFNEESMLTSGDIVSAIQNY